MRRALFVAVLALSACQARSNPQPADRPNLALLTSLPIVFGERFGLDQQRSPLLADLEDGFAVLPVDGPETLEPGGLLLAVQPQALTAERLVTLDRWVRNGGRILLLADPVLRFDSERPLGDRFRPPLRYPDTGLLAHWGVTLDDAVSAGPDKIETDLGRGVRLQAAGLGSFTRAGGDCTLSPTRTVARCRIGKGYATLVADADFAIADEAGQRAVVSKLLRELAR